METYRYALYMPSGRAYVQLYVLNYTDSSGLCLCLNAADIWRVTITSLVANKIVTQTGHTPPQNFTAT